VVPKLSGLSLAGAKRKLKAAHCKLGKVTKPRLKKSQKHRPLIVSRQSQKAGKQLAEGTAVSLTLGPKKAKRRHHH
jgi:beta-lactam-binding protein with PASTA domain